MAPLHLNMMQTVLPFQIIELLALFTFLRLDPHVTIRVHPLGALPAEVTSPCQAGIHQSMCRVDTPP